MKNELAKIKIVVPKGCTKTNLSIDALDSRTRELANQTFIYADDKQLLCRSMKLTEKAGEQVVVLEVRAECFEFVEADENPEI